MGQVVFILLVLGGLGFFFYRHTDKNSNQCTLESDSCSGAEHKPGTNLNNNISLNNDKTVDTQTHEDSLEDQIMDMVCRTPGILQTEFYRMLPAENRKNLQATLLQMDRDGQLRREREGSTYRLFIA